MVITLCKQIISFFFPDTCQGCSRGDDFICRNCLTTIRPLPQLQCPECFAPSDYGIFCEGCKATVRSYLDFLLVGASYKDNRILSLLIKTLKYKKLKRAIQFLPDVLFQDIKNLVQKVGVENVLLVPIPLHKRREKERGFNQARVIADNIGKRYGVRVLELLVRKRYTKSQALLTKTEREQNLKEAFMIRRDMRATEEKVVILIDDVASTRSTLEEAAGVCRFLPLRAVGAFVLARN